MVTSRKANMAVKSSHNPLVSVVLPSYQQGDTLKSCLDSVLSQSFSNIEIIVRDDCSIDSSRDILNKVRDPRLRVIFSKTNIGASANANLATAAASGKYIAVINGDDVMMPNRIQQQIEYLENNVEVGLIFAVPRVVAFDRKSGVEHSEIVDHGFRDFNGTRHLLARKLFDHGNFLCHPTAMIRRSVYNQVGLYDCRLKQLPDYDLWVRSLSYTTIAIPHQGHTTYRQMLDKSNESAATPVSLVRDIWERAKVLQEYTKYPLDDLKMVFPEFKSLLTSKEIVFQACLAHGGRSHIAAAREIAYSMFSSDAIPKLDSLSSLVASGGTTRGNYVAFHSLTGIGT